MALVLAPTYPRSPGHLGARVGPTLGPAVVLTAALREGRHGWVGLHGRTPTAPVWPARLAQVVGDGMIRPPSSRIPSAPAGGNCPRLP